MAIDRQTSRGVNLAGTAGALVALVAITAMMSSIPGAPGPRGHTLPTEARTALSEAPSVRAVAAAVAAAARELVGSDQLHTALPAQPFVISLACQGQSCLHPIEHAQPPHLALIDVRLIDRPPPTCC